MNIIKFCKVLEGGEENQLNQDFKGRNIFLKILVCIGDQL